jgi:hypothetical protein
MSSFLRGIFVLSLMVGGCAADWRENAGYYLLQAELGAQMPTGAGISVMMSEANAGGYLPQATAGTVPFAGTGGFSGKTLTPHSGASGLSSHAASVATYYFSNSASMAPGVTDVHCWLADDVAVSLVSGTPPVYAGSVHNHSWVGSFGTAALDTAVLRRLDYLIARDSVIVVTPLNNGLSMQPLLGNSHHAIAVGVLSGSHPVTGSNTDGTGRMKPDLVVAQGVTSNAGPSVASAAALLLDAIRPAHPVADDPRVVKALLLAAASKKNLLGWQRANLSKPYDATWGAGELNIRHAYHILSAGRAVPQIAADVPERGWDLGMTATLSPPRYFFTVEEGRWADQVSIAITWHRDLAPPAFAPTLADLNLRLFKADAFEIQGLAIDQSVSTLDNVEHCFLRNLPAGQYAMEVTSATDAVPFAIAWEVQLGAGPQLSLRRESNGSVHLDLSQLDPFVTYTIESSETLLPLSWGTAGTLRTADTTPATTATWQETDPNPPLARFYRLKWTTP